MYNLNVNSLNTSSMVDFISNILDISGIYADGKKFCTVAMAQKSLI